MTQSMKSAPADIYEAVLALSRSIAGRSDLESLLSGVAESVQRIVNFDFVGVTLYDRKSDRMQGRILAASAKEGATVGLPLDQDPAGWVLRNQQPLVIRSLEDDDRWPEFRDYVRWTGVTAMTIVPLTEGDNRLGAFGFGCRAPYQPSPIELSFLERVASEFAVAVQSSLARQQAIRERDRLQTLFDITNALVSRLGTDELFSAIAVQLSRVIRHDFCVLTLYNGARALEMAGLHFSGVPLFEKLEGNIDLEGLPGEEALATGKPVVALATDLDRYPSPIFRRRVELGCKSACSVPLVTGNGTLGTLELVRTTTDVWTHEDVDFLVQVARQIAIAVENALSYRELREMKERLATEKLYLEDEIRLDHNAGNMVGQGPAFESILKSIHIVAPTDSTVLILGETNQGRQDRRSPPTPNARHRHSRRAHRPQ